MPPPRANTEKAWKSQWKNDGESDSGEHAKKEYEYSKFSNDLRIRNNVKVKDLSKREIKEIEPNIADVY